MTWPPYGERLLALADLHPTAEMLREVLCSGDRTDLEVIASLWLTEGIPSTFARHPALYEHIRRNLARRLEVCAKSISITGSRRTGYSMKPKKWGAPVRPNSDFDLLIVDEGLFDASAIEFSTWVKDFQQGKCQPSTAAEHKYWPSNVTEGKRDIDRRLFAPVMRIPRRPECPGRVKLGETLTATLWQARRLARHLGAGDLFVHTPKGKFPFHVRLYRDWDAAVAGVCRSLTFAASQLTI